MANCGQLRSNGIDVSCLLEVVLGTRERGKEQKIEKWENNWQVYVTAYKLDDIEIVGVKHVLRNTILSRYSTMYRLNG